jgi:hypothetical protein
MHGTLTLLRRALRDDATRLRAHLFRLGSVLVILLFLVVAHATSSGVSAPGRRFFELITWLNLALIVLAGASYFSGTITEEKEQGTLGLLRLAGVSTLGLLLGKSTSRLISVLLMFLAQLPFAMLAISLGGITARQILAADLALAAFLVLVANFGLLISVIAPRSGLAGASTFVGCVALLGGAQLGTHIARILDRERILDAGTPLGVRLAGLVETASQLSIITRLRAILPTGFDGTLVSDQVLCDLGVGVGAFLLSWLVFDRFTRYVDVSAPTRGGVPTGRRRWSLATGRTWRWALVWKDYHFLMGGHVAALTKPWLYAGTFLGLWWWRDSAWTVTGFRFEDLVGVVMLTLIAGELCLAASRLFHDELKWGTLSSLAVLPHATWRIAVEKVGGCLLGLVPALIALVCVTVLVPGSFSWLRTLQSAEAEDVVWWLMAVHLLVLLHLTVLLSLYVKWGALALAVAVLLVLDALLSLPFAVVVTALTVSYGREFVALGPILYAGCGISAVLAALILMRVREVASR